MQNKIIFIFVPSGNFSFSILYYFSFIKLSIGIILIFFIISSFIY